MAVEVGAIIEGKVTGLTKFGAFVELPEGKVGMVHISEVASTYVKEISDFLKEGQIVKVKVLTIDESGKIGLSIKKALENSDNKENRPQQRQYNNNNNNNYKRNNNRSNPNVWTGSRDNKSYGDSNMSFEDMMSKFKQVSDEKMTDLKRASESKHGGFSRRGGNKQYR